MTSYHTTNPATGELVKEFPVASGQEVREAPDRADAAYRPWRGVDAAERADLPRRVARLHRDRADELARIITLEIGKPITPAKGAVALVAAHLRPLRRARSGFAGR
ncbi:aldehyde dehydrogenase family protein [Amycolatopsis methanolica]|uniref:aldehyde dehydrogenase family protein n=1 Tax=Amycolatopsis methanolica TaxID=1814 RepID=UPI0034162023